MPQNASRWVFDYQAEWIQKLGGLPWLVEPSSWGWWVSHYMLDRSPMVELVFLAPIGEDADDPADYLMITGADAGELVSGFASKWLSLAEFVRAVGETDAEPT